jgi:hypothetical protein
MRVLTVLAVLLWTTSLHADDVTNYTGYIPRLESGIAVRDAPVESPAPSTPTQKLPCFA